MKLRRKVICTALLDNWCPSCAAKTLEYVPSGMPGIPARKCSKCSSGYLINMLEDVDDMMEIGPQDDFGPYMEKQDVGNNSVRGAESCVIVRNVHIAGGDLQRSDVDNPSIEKSTR